jgi:hypothetical protein
MPPPSPFARPCFPPAPLPPMRPTFLSPFRRAFLKPPLRRRLYARRCRAATLTLAPLRVARGMAAPAKPQPASRSTSCSKRRAGASSRMATRPPTSARTQRHHQVRRPRRARRELREDPQGLRRLPAARRQGLPAHRPGGQGRGQEPARRQGAGPQVRPLPELPLRHPLQRQPALLLGSGTRQPVPHHLVSRRPDSVIGYQKVTPDPKRLIEEQVGEDYIVLTQRPNYQSEAAWKNEAERPATSRPTSCASCALPAEGHPQPPGAVKDGKDRFLFEMATGTGKTLTAAAVIKLFLRSGNARRVLFLVDRLELEDQAKKAFRRAALRRLPDGHLQGEPRRLARAEIVVTTVQSLLFNNKYQKLFSPTDFDLVISDEAHRSIGGNARAVFDYFIGYKLGLTATPRDYLKRFDSQPHHPRPARGRAPPAARHLPHLRLREQPAHLPLLAARRREGRLPDQPHRGGCPHRVTTQLLSEEGFVVSFTDDTGEDQEEAFKQREFEKRFFSDATNQLFCKTFLENALRDPVSGEIGKSIIFAVSQNHAAKLAQILNQMADRMFPGKYQSDFAVQVTSQVPTPSSSPSTSPTTTCSARATSSRLQDQQGARLRHRRHDDHRLRLPGHPQPRPVPPDLLAHRLHPDQGPRHPQARLPRAALRRSLKAGVQSRTRPPSSSSTSSPTASTSRRVQLRRGAEAAAARKGKAERRRWRRPGRPGRRHLRAPRRRHPLHRSRKRPDRLRGHEDRPHVLREVRGHRARERLHRRQPSRPASGTASSTT